ncbi:MAG: hypothetical protein A2885_22850 [Sphingopyxis sp. RIFCSPHIGHO2_01_FULL_65_24]|nr:MAG: hypothetical protein A2885_22850 [Sphingopyxis sp. RIFCSPHIGHO2_01_FULL_65_24]
MKPISLLWATALLCGAPALAQEAVPDLPYAMTNSVTLPSSDTGWDYVKFEPGTSRLFMARLHDGLTVYDVDRGQAVATIENSVGANGPILLPKYNRGYVAMADGSLLSFDLKTLKVIARTPLAGDGGLNSGSLDPATGQLHIITGTRPSEATWFSLDAATGKLLRTTRFPFRKMDDPAADGKGHLYAPARLDGLVLRLDSATLKEQARWDVGCNVSKMKYLAATDRLLGACGGDRPAVFLMDPASGAILSRVTIGKGLDALAYDEERERIVSSNYEGSMTVIRREGRDSLRVVATIRTAFGARMMDIDHRTGRLYLVNADSTDFPGKDGGEEVTRYHPDSFRVETWQPY